jgi:hypothetical protein
MGVFAFQSGVMFAVYVALLLVKAYAFIDALTRRSDAFPAADKQTKVAWLWITGLSLAAEIILPGPIGLVSLIGTIASFVYILDVRPAVHAVTRR